MSDDEKIKISLDEVEHVVLPNNTLQSSPTSGSPAKSYGTLAIGQPSRQARGGSFLLQAWVYLGIAGLVGALLGWALCEPFFLDGNRRELFRWGNYVMMKLVVVFICLGYALAESLVERSIHKAVLRSVLAILVGTVLSFGFEFVANLIYNTLRHVFQPESLSSISLARCFGWAAFGVVGGIVYGVIGKSMKKGLYGMVGGLAGAALGGLIFDPISLVTQMGGPSRAIGFGLFGGFTGIAIGLVESALKDRWLYVAGGPLAGKQFILYKEQTVFGSQQAADVYLFKDPSILPEHAVLSLRGKQAILKSVGAVLVNGKTVQEQVLHTGDQIQIGRYTFEFQEKSRPN